MNFSFIGAVNFAVTNFTDPNISSGTTYFYRVRAGNAAGYSAYTRIASAPLAFSTAYQSGSNLVLSGFEARRQCLLYLDLNKCELARGAMAVRGENYFESSGGFSITNVVDPGTAGLFYRIQLR